MADSPWPTIHAERKALADDLAGLNDQQWQTPSLCDGWSVHDMLGHIVATNKMSPPKFFGHFISSGFNFAKMANKDIKTETAGGPAATLAEFNAHLNDTSAPPGPIDAMLGEALIHTEDIRRPLGIKRAYPIDATVRTLDFFKKSNLIIGAKNRIAGVTLKATDTDWSTGSGPEAAGPAHSLLMAMTGRKSALDDLSGPGVDVLRSRA
jgi:uncharacterized protein (TIGR03083 family)